MTNGVLTKGTDTVDEANQLLAAGYRVCLLIDSEMLETKHQTEAPIFANHWVVLRSPIDLSGGKARMTVFTWGKGDYQVPQSGDLPLAQFQNKFYGYVAAKP